MNERTPGHKHIVVHAVMGGIVTGFEDAARVAKEKEIFCALPAVLQIVHSGCLPTTPWRASYEVCAGVPQCPPPLDFLVSG